MITHKDRFGSAQSEQKKGVLETCQRWQHAPLLSQHENTHKYTRQIKNMNTEPYSLCIFFLQCIKMTTKIENCRLSASEKRLHACLAQVSWKHKKRTDLHRISSKKLMISATALQHRLHNSPQLKNKPQHNVLRHHHHHMQHPFSASLVGADSRFSSSAANRLLGPGGKGYVVYMYAGRCVTSR